MYFVGYDEWIGLYLIIAMFLSYAVLNIVAQTELWDSVKYIIIPNESPLLWYTPF